MSKIYEIFVKDTGDVFYCNEKYHFHQDSGLPAIKRANGTNEWWFCGELHRDGGLPAIEYADGSKLWYNNGVEITEEQSKLLT